MASAAVVGVDGDGELRLGTAEEGSGEDDYDGGPQGGVVGAGELGNVGAMDYVAAHGVGVGLGSDVGASSSSWLREGNGGAAKRGRSKTLSHLYI